MHWAWDMRYNLVIYPALDLVLLGRIAMTW